jgi:hypothetical protein
MRHLIDRLVTVDGTQKALALIVIDQGLGLLSIDALPLPNDLFLIIGTLPSQRSCDELLFWHFDMDDCIQ